MLKPCLGGTAVGASGFWIAYRAAIAATSGIEKRRPTSQNGLALNRGSTYSSDPERDPNICTVCHTVAADSLLDGDRRIAGSCARCASSRCGHHLGARQIDSTTKVSCADNVPLGVESRAEPGSVYNRPCQLAGWDVHGRAETSIFLSTGVRASFAEGLSSNLDPSVVTPM